MGLSSLPTPSEGVLTLVLVNTAISIAILKEIARSFLAVLGFRPASSSPGPDRRPPEPGSAEPTLTDRFRTRFKPVRFGSLFGRCRRHADDCRVCLSRFEAESVVDRLPCGHLFHRSCVETWLDYHHATCPLCRTRLLPFAADEPSPSPALL